MFYTNSIGPIGEDDGSTEDYAANLDAAFSDLDGTTVWLGPVGFLSDEGDLMEYFSRIQPEFVVPQHFDGLTPDIEAGLTTPFAPTAALTQVLADEGSTLVAPEQYFDVFILGPDGVVQSNEAPVQEAFGL